MCAPWILAVLGGPALPWWGVSGLVERQEDAGERVDARFLMLLSRLIVIALVVTCGM